MVYKELTLIEFEKDRLNSTYNFIPSENLPNKYVLQALGSFINYKYTEGYPGKRYYNGNENYDKIENLCIENAKKLFKCKIANVQPLSGSVANIALISNLLKPNDKIVSMSLNSGGHLTHGSPQNFIGKTYKIINYPLDEKFEINYDLLKEIVKFQKPKLIISGATCYSKKINFKRIGEIASEYGAYHLSDISHIAGLVVTGLHQSPIKYADFVTTTTHKTLKGPRGALIMSNNKEYDKLINTSIFPHFQGGTHPNIIAAKSICFQQAMTKNFRYYMEKVLSDTKYFCERLQDVGFKIVGDTTENHLFLVDLSPLKIDGRTAADLLEEQGIIVNANSIPNDKGTPFRPQGIRLGTALETGRGLTQKDINKIVKIMKETLIT